MVNPADPLKGFVLFPNTKESLMVTVGSGYVRISADTLRIIGSPTHINVFFDDFGKRMLVKAAKKDMPNVFGFSKSGSIANYGGVREKILQLAEITPQPGDVIRFFGKKHGDDFAIFCLAEPKITKYSMHLVRKKEDHDDLSD